MQEADRHAYETRVLGAVRAILEASSCDPAPGSLLWKGIAILDVRLENQYPNTEIVVRHKESDGPVEEMGWFLWGERSIFGGPGGEVDDPEAIAGIVHANLVEP